MQVHIKKSVLKHISSVVFVKLMDRQLMQVTHALSTEVTMYIPYYERQHYISQSGESNTINVHTCLNLDVKDII